MDNGDKFCDRMECSQRMQEVMTCEMGCPEQAQRWWYMMKCNWESQGMMEWHWQWTWSGGYLFIRLKTLSEKIIQMSSRKLENSLGWTLIQEYYIEC